ncbi:glycosyltransferase, partial [Algibacter sp.]|uniref:glycosyltransferase n=1 Tax=Algibacter sp. TaxID=1872428 RepID=UPI003C76681C
SIKKATGFISLLRKRKIDIIFSFLPKDTIFSGIYGKIAKVPYIFGGIRNSHVAWTKFAALKLINNRLLSFTIANNFAAYDSSIDFGFKKNVFVIPNGIEIRTISKRLKTDKNLITIISLGRLVKQKDYDTAIKSIANLKQILNKKYNIKYKIVGQGPEESGIIDTIKKYDVSEEVELITNATNIYELLDASDIYLCTSTFEGISNSIMEAMNCGLPIVATDAGDNSRLVINGKNGFVTPIGAYKEISQHLASLIESTNLKEEMGLASYDHLKENFGYETFQKKYLNLIENISTLQIQNGEPIFLNKIG